jgi:hypothetical protein
MDGYVKPLGVGDLYDLLAMMFDNGDVIKFDRDQNRVLIIE